MIKRTLPLLSLFFLSIILTTDVKAQSIYFCWNHDKCTPISAGNDFAMTSKDIIYMVCQLPNSYQCDSVFYDLYFVDDTGKEEDYYSRGALRSAFESNCIWDGFDMLIPYDYKVYIYDCHDNVIATGSFKVRAK